MLNVEVLEFANIRNDGHDVKSAVDLNCANTDVVKIIVYPVVAYQSANMENDGDGAWIVLVQPYANTTKTDKIVLIVAAICIANTINTNHDVKFVAGLNYVKRHYVKRAV